MEELLGNYLKVVQFAFRHALVNRTPLHQLRYRLRDRPQPASAVRTEVCYFIALAQENPHLSMEVMKWIMTTDMDEVSDYTLLGIASTEPPPGTTCESIGWA